MEIDPLSDAKIIDSWNKNATTWRQCAAVISRRRKRLSVIQRGNAAVGQSTDAQGCVRSTQTP
jgi:hypothetical protein